MDLGERFELLGELGAGGTGTVFRVLDRQRGEELALKTLRSHAARDVYRFKREFRMLADLVHPNLIRLHELFAVDDEWMFTMALVDGVRFRQWVRPGGPEAPLDEARLRDALTQLVDGLTALHAAGKLHRDLKPSNVLVEPTGRVVILDFGLVADVETVNVDRSQEHVAVGTPSYMSPEQSGDQPLTAASDWYSVGAMLYEVLTGRRPFEGSTATVLVRKQRQDPLPPSALAGDVPADLEALCLRLLQRDPTLRPDGLQVLAALGRAPSEATRRAVAQAAPTQLLGRDRELAMLHTALADSRDHPVLVLLTGPDGAGKTELLDAFVGELRAADQAVVLLGRGDEREQVRFRALDRVVDSLSAYLIGLPAEEIAALIPGDVAVLVRLFPALGRVAALHTRTPPGAVPEDADEMVRRGLVALLVLVGRIATARPMVCAIDDVHAATVEGARLLHAFTGPGAPRMLMVLVHRGGVAENALAVLQEIEQWRGDLRRIDLSGSSG